MPPAIEEHSVLCGRVVNIVKRRFDKPIRIPAVIIGGSHVECVATDRKRPVKCGWRFDVASVGYPGVVRCGRIACEPYDLGNGWNGFDFQAALARPVKVINDAAMQAPGGYDAETMLFLGLRMALGSALIVDGAITAMELKQLYCADGLAYEEYFGALERK
ncbi:MAG TPA: hypothetical protein VNF49_12430, partial [Candidatus Binataceae bacterium]|nr:hypothetical protein [Candidatus Binataceae bacterium]